MAIKIKSSWKVFIPLSFLFVFSFYLGVREFFRWYKIKNEYISIEREIEATKSKTEELKLEYDNLGNPKLLEKEVRERLNLKKDGEYVLVVVGENNFPEENFNEATISSVVSKKEGILFNIDSWKRYIFH